jgi:hypothetical protein
MFVVALSCLTCVRKASFSNLEPDIDYPNILVISKLHQDAIAWSHFLSNSCMPSMLTSSVELDQEAEAKIKQDTPCTRTSNVTLWRGETSPVFLLTKYHLNRRRRFYCNLIAPTIVTKLGGTPSPCGIVVPYHAHRLLLLSLPLRLGSLLLTPPPFDPGYRSVVT